jgi:hypothetical protein
MKKLLLNLLAGLCLVQIPTVHGMDAKFPTIEDADDHDNVLNANQAPSSTAVIPAGQTPAGSSVALRSAKSNLTHVASVENNQGQVMHLRVNADSIAQSLNEISTGLTQGLQKAVPVATHAMQQFTQQADQTLQVVGAGVDTLATHGTAAITKMGAAGGNAVGNIVNAATSEVAAMGYALSDATTSALNSVNDEGRATISEISTAGQNLSNNAAQNAQQTLRVAATQATRVVGHARNAATKTLEGVNKVATTIGTQVNQVAATVATPANMKALGDSEGAQQFAAHAGNGINKLAGAVSSVAAQTNRLLDNGTKVLQAAKPAMSNIAKITGDVAQHTPTLLQNLNNVLAGTARNLNPTIGDAPYTQQYLPTSNTNGPTVEDITDSAPLALPSPEEFQKLAPARKQASQRQLLAAVKDIVNGTNVSVSAEFAQNAYTATRKVTQQQVLLTPEEYSILLAATQKAQTTNADANAQLMLEWKTDNTKTQNPENPALTPAATPSQLGTLRHELTHLNQVGSPAAHQNAPARSLTAVLPKPVLVIGACVCVTGLIIVAKKLYTKWKKNKEKKEKREQQRQQVAAQQPEEINA